jgi:hypothetical protein
VFYDNRFVAGEGTGAAAAGGAVAADGGENGLRGESSDSPNGNKAQAVLTAGVAATSSLAFSMVLHIS